MPEQPSADYLAAFRSLGNTAARVLGGSNHEHEWEIVDTWRPASTPVHPRMQADVPSTFVLVVCKICHFPQTTELDGKWTTDQVRGISEQPALDDQP